MSPNWSEEEQWNNGGKRRQSSRALPGHSGSTGHRRYRSPFSGHTGTVACALWLTVCTVSYREMERRSGREEDEGIRAEGHFVGPLSLGDTFLEKDLKRKERRGGKDERSPTLQWGFPSVGSTDQCSRFFERREEIRGLNRLHSWTFGSNIKVSIGAVRCEISPINQPC